MNTYAVSIREIRQFIEADINAREQWMSDELEIAELLMQDVPNKRRFLTQCEE